ncbi:MAG: FkbM family methyltransferase [Sulfolobales archaeon]
MYIYRFLQLNTARLNNVRIFPYAISDRCGVGILYAPKSFLTAISSLKNVHSYYLLSDRHVVKIRVPMITLDRYISRCGEPPTFIKIDVEGAEDLVVSGGIETLKRFRPRVSMEVWGDPLPSDAHLKAAEKLQELGYQPYRILSNGSLERISLKDLKSVKGFDNVVFQIP